MLQCSSKSICNMCLRPANPSLQKKCAARSKCRADDDFFCDDCWKSDSLFACDQCPAGTYICPLCSVPQNVHCGSCGAPTYPDAKSTALRCDSHDESRCGEESCAAEEDGAERFMCGNCTHVVFRYSGDKGYVTCCTRCVQRNSGINHSGCHCRKSKGNGKSKRKC